MDMVATIIALDLMKKERDRREREFNKMMRKMDRRMERSAHRYKIDRMFYDIGFSKVPYRSGRVPDGGVVFEPRKGAALVFNSYHDAEQWLKKAGVWKS